MQVLKSMGGVANGWAKFAVTLLAVGWFGVYALNRVIPPSDKTPKPDVNMISRYDEGLLSPSTDAPDSKNLKDSEINAVGASGAPSSSMVGTLGSEIWTSLTSLFGAKAAQLVLAFLSGTGIGLAGRPTITYLNKRRIAAAKKLLKNIEQAQILAAKAGERGIEPVSTTAIAPPNPSVTANVLAPRV